jgi:hypothetical protein
VYGFLNPYAFSGKQADIFGYFAFRNQVLPQIIKQIYMSLFYRMRVLLLILFVTAGRAVFSQNYVEIGTGIIDNSMPIYSSWNYSWSDLIYSHTDLGTAKTITAIGLNCSNGPKTVSNQKIYVKLSSNTVYATAGYEDPANGYTLVYDGPLTFQTGWNQITLTTPIVYDGVQNLLIHWENRWGATYGPKFLSTASVTNNNKNCGNDVMFPPATQTGYLNPYPSSVANMRFYYASSGPATPVAPVPADNATVVSVDTDLSWTLGANTTQYDLYFGTNPASMSLVVSNATAVPGTNSYTIPGLLADSTMHYWKVVAKNGSQTESSPVWKFKTEVVIDQFPYSEGFEDSVVFHTYPVTSAWIVSPDVSWYEYNVNAHSGSLCAKSSFCTTGNVATLRSPKVLLPAGYSMSYFWRNTSVNKVAGHDTTYLEVSANGGLNWTAIDTLSPLTANADYVQRTRNLNAYAGNSFYFRFRHVTDNSGSACNIYLDDISIYATGATATLSVSPSNQNVTAPAGSTSFTVTSNSAWNVSSDQAWCSVPTSGNGNGSIPVNYTENTGGSSRLAHITVTVTGLSPVVVTVTQAAAAASLSVSPPNQNVTSPAGTTDFSVVTGSSWTAVSDQTWCTVPASGNGNATLQASYTENTGLTLRVAHITVTVSGLTPVEVTVTQDAAGVILMATPANQDVTYPAGTTNFTVNANIAWTAVSDAGWCAVTPSGTGAGTLFANYAENTIATVRVAHITLSGAGAAPVSLTVTQSGPAAVMNITPLVQNVTWQAGMTTFAIATNTQWTAVSNAAWCQPTASGTGSGVISATYGANSGGSERTALITVTADGVTPVELQLIQLPSFVSVEESESPGLSVYPNPAHGQVYLSTAGIPEGTEAGLFSPKGECLTRFIISGKSQSLCLSGLSPGMYLLRVGKSPNLTERKIIVQ